MIIEDNNGLVRLLAEGTNKITNAERSFFTDFIYLGNSDSPSNYEEVGREIWKHFVKEENPDMNELIERVNDLENSLETLSNQYKLLINLMSTKEE